MGIHWLLHYFCCFLNTNTAITQQLIQTARTPEAECWHVCGEAWVRGQRRMSQVLDAFGLMDFTMLRSVLNWRAFCKLWTVYFFKFPNFFSARGEPRIRASGCIHCILSLISISTKIIEIIRGCVLFKRCIQNSLTNTYKSFPGYYFRFINKPPCTHAFNWSYYKTGVTYICRLDIHSALGRLRQAYASTHELCLPFLFVFVSYMFLCIQSYLG